MATLTAFVGTGGSSGTGSKGTAWTNLANAEGSTAGNFATLVSAARSEVGTWTGASFDFSAIPAGATINSVTATVQHLESNTTVISTLTGQLAISGTLQGTATAFTKATAARSDTIPDPGTITQADLPNLQVVVVSSRSNSTTSTTQSIDWASVTVDYTAISNVAGSGTFQGAADATGTGLPAVVSSGTVQGASSLDGTAAIAVQGSGTFQGASTLSGLPMGIWPTHLVAEGDTSNLASYTTASITANADDILCVAVIETATTATSSTVTGTGLTFTRAREASTGAANRAALHWALVPSGGFTGTLGIAFASPTTPTGAAWHIFTIRGADTSAPFSTTNIDSGAPAAATSVSRTLPSAVASGNQVVAVVVHTANEATVAGTGFTIIGGAGTFGGYITPATSIAAEFGLNGQTYSASWTTSASIMVIGVEVIAAGGAVTPVAGFGTFQGASTLNGTGLEAEPGAGLLQGAASLAGTGVAAVAASGTFQGASSLTGSAGAGIPGSGTLQGASSLTGTALVAVTGSGTLQGASVLTGTGLRAEIGSGTLQGASSLTGTASIKVIGTGTFQGASVLAGSSFGATQGSGTLQAASSLTGQAVIAKFGEDFFIAASILDGQALVAVIASGEFAGASLLSGTQLQVWHPTPRRTGTATPRRSTTTTPRRSTVTTARRGE